MTHEFTSNKDLGVEIDRIDGLDIYLKGHPYPLHNLPTIEIMYAINRAKQSLKEFKLNIYPILEPYIPDSFSSFGIELYFFLSRLFPKRKQLCLAISTILEYDLAYKYRAQDIFNETTKERLCTKPFGEIRRLIKLYRDRDTEVVSKKLIFYGNLFSLFLLWPPVRRRFRNALNSIHYANLLPTEADTYWMKQRWDYKYFGIRHEKSPSSLKP